MKNRNTRHQTPPTRNSLRFLFKLQIFFSLFFLCGCATVYNPATGREEVYFIDDAQEVSMGKAMASEIKKESKLIYTPKDINFINKIGAKIAKVSDRNYLNYEFYILDEEGMNAFTLPGGFIFLNKGLLDQANEDEVAFVIAHEIGHTAARHSVKRLQASLGVNFILSFALRSVESSSIESAIGIVYNVVSLGYSRQDELLADSLAVRYTKASGYNPKAGLTLMEKLSIDQNNDFSLTFLRSHPPAEQRAQNIRRQVYLNYN